MMRAERNIGLMEYADLSMYVSEDAMIVIEINNVTMRFSVDSALEFLEALSKTIDKAEDMQTPFDDTIH